MHSHKLLPFESAKAHFRKIRQTGKTIVQCHGTFDLVHPGHIYHLEEAKSLGDILVVTVTADKFINKGPGRPFFKNELRCRTLASLACVDYVVLIPHPGAIEAIECVRPNVYCKGREYKAYEDNPKLDPTGRFFEDLAAVKRCRGRVHYLGDVVFSSTRLLNQHFNPEIRDFCSTVLRTTSPQQLREAVDAFAPLRVLVIGDIILDRYSYLNVQGLTSKNRIISGRYLREETQAGGALAVHRHIKQFCQNVKLVSLVGTEPWVGRELSSHLRPGDDALIRDPDFTTIIKQRFVEPPSEGKELSKLFAVNYLNDGHPSKKAQRSVLARVAKCIRECDLVVVADFGHGLMQEEVRDLVQEKAPFLALNCQTNSANFGFNIISRQYRRADAFSLDAQEILLSSGRRGIDFGKELSGLRRRLASKYAWLTRGVVDTIGIRAGGGQCVCPPLESEVTDTVGAGDAFFSVASLAARQDLPIPLATLLGQLAGAQAVKIVGNSKPISKDTLIRWGVSLLNM